MKSGKMKHEMTLFHTLRTNKKCFVSFCQHIWSCVELFSETFNIDDTGPFESPLLPRTQLYLVMKFIQDFRGKQLFQIFQIWEI